MKLYLVKDGIENAKIVDIHGNRLFGTDYYSITWDLIQNEGYINKIDNNTWKLYTRIGQKLVKSQYYFCETFELCIDQLNILCENADIRILSQRQLKEMVKAN